MQAPRSAELGRCSLLWLRLLATDQLEVKTHLRASAADTELLAASKAARDAVTAEDAVGCYADCGFLLPPQLPQATLQGGGLSSSRYTSGS